MVSRHHAKFGGHWHCGSGDIFLMAEEQDCTCRLNLTPLSLKYMTCYALTPKIAERRHSYFRLYVVRNWLAKSTSKIKKSPSYK